jgi:hypothetical protein
LNVCDTFKGVIFEPDLPHWQNNPESALIGGSFPHIPAKKTCSPEPLADFLLQFLVELYGKFELDSVTKGFPKIYELGTLMLNLAESFLDAPNPIRNRVDIPKELPDLTLGWGLCLFSLCS